MCVCGCCVLEREEKGLVRLCTQCPGGNLVRNRELMIITWAETEPASATVIILKIHEHDEQWAKMSIVSWWARWADGCRSSRNFLKNNQDCTPQFFIHAWCYVFAGAYVNCLVDCWFVCSLLSPTHWARIHVGKRALLILLLLFKLLKWGPATLVLRLLLIWDLLLHICST